MTLLTTTMCPFCRRFMSGRTALIILTTPKKLVSKMRFISSTLTLSTGPTCPTPALFTAEPYGELRDPPQTPHGVYRPPGRSPSTSTRPPGMLAMHSATELSLQTSRRWMLSVVPSAAPAAASNFSFFRRSRMVAITGGTPNPKNQLGGDPGCQPGQGQVGTMMFVKLLG